MIKIHSSCNIKHRKLRSEIFFTLSSNSHAHDPYYYVGSEQASKIKATSKMKKTSKKKTPKEVETMYLKKEDDLDMKTTPKMITSN